jgi:hypothetical protein
MKHTRLLEIIREEIAGALNEITVVDKKTSSAEATEIAKSENSDINTVKNAIIQAKKSGKPVNVAEEKRKKLAEKYQLDEETINEMASVVQTKKALSKLVDAGLSPKENLDLVIDVEKETLDQFKNSNPSMTSDGRLIRKLKPEEITGKRDTKGYGADFEQNFKKKSGVRFDDFTADIEDKFNKAFPGEKKFNSGLATNTTEKDAAAQIFNLEKGKQGRKADPNKEEKPASTGKKGRPAGEPKAEKTATLTKGDDGFDDVSYSDDEEGPSAKDIAGDETAKELGNTPEEKKLKFNQFLASVKKNKDDKAKIDGILKIAKDKFKFSKQMMDDLKRSAGRDVQ